MIIESIKEGFQITHRSWQVILLRVLVTIVSLVGFLFFIGIPIAIAIAYLSVDIANIKNILPELLSEDPLELLSKYLGIVILLFIAFTLYLTFVSVLALYVFGGMLGVLKNAALNIQYRFSLSSFFKEAKNLFFPLLWLFSIAFLVITCIVIVFVIFSGFVFFLVHASGESGTTFSTFVAIFFILLIIFLSLIIGFASVIFTVYAAIALVVENKGVSDSFKKAWNFLKNKPMASLFYIILVFGIMAVNIVLMIFGGSFNMIPLIGIIISIPYQLAVYALQSYLSVVMWGSLIVFYIRGTKHPVYPDRKKAPPEPSDRVYTATYDI